MRLRSANNKAARDSGGGLEGQQQQPTDASSSDLNEGGHRNNGGGIRCKMKSTKDRRTRTRRTNNAHAQIIKAVYNDLFLLYISGCPPANSSASAAPDAVAAAVAASASPSVSMKDFELLKVLGTGGECTDKASIVLGEAS